MCILSGQLLSDGFKYLVLDLNVDLCSLYIPRCYFVYFTAGFNADNFMLVL